MSKKQNYGAAEIAEVHPADFVDLGSLDREGGLGLVEDEAEDGADLPVVERPAVEDSVGRDRMLAATARRLRAPKARQTSAFCSGPEP